MLTHEGKRGGDGKVFLLLKGHPSYPSEAGLVCVEENEQIEVAGKEETA